MANIFGLLTLGIDDTALSSIYFEDGSSGVVCGGDVLQNREMSDIAVGGAVGGGSSGNFFVCFDTAVGGAVGGGSSGLFLIGLDTAVGGAVGGGSSGIFFTYLETSRGGVLIGGLAELSHPPRLEVVITNKHTVISGRLDFLRFILDRNKENPQENASGGHYEQIIYKRGDE